MEINYHTIDLANGTDFLLVISCENSETVWEEHITVQNCDSAIDVTYHFEAIIQKLGIGRRHIRMAVISDPEDIDPFEKHYYIRAFHRDFGDTTIGWHR